MANSYRVQGRKWTSGDRIAANPRPLVGTEPQGERVLADESPASIENYGPAVPRQERASTATVGLMLGLGRSLNFCPGLRGISPALAPVSGGMLEWQPASLPSSVAANRVGIIHQEDRPS